MKLLEIVRRKQYLVLILVLAAALRFVGPATNPPSLNWDEVSHGYNAYSILTTGRDEWGVTFPAIFRAYGDYKLPVYIYLTAISEFVFGLTPFAVRFVSLAAGVATVYFTYLLSRELFPKQTVIPLLTSLLVAIEPWTLFMSRAAFEANLAIAFIVAGFFFLLKSLTTLRLMLPSAVLLGLAVWTYNSARIFVPAMLVAVCFIFRQRFLANYKANPKTLFAWLLVLGLFIFPMFWQLAHPVGQARYSKVAIIDQGAVNKIEHARLTTKLPGVIAKFVYNRPAYFTLHFGENYLSHFTPAFLGFKGGSQYQFSVPGLGVLYAADLIFIVLGCVFTLSNKLDLSRNARLVLLTWLILSPVASSLTREAPHVLRASVILPIPMILSAIGVVGSVEWLAARRVPSKLTWLAYAACMVLLVASYLSAYYGRYRTSYSWSWQYGYEQVVDYTKAHYSDYDKIVMTKKYGEPHEFVLFYSKWLPSAYHDDPKLVRFSQSDWFWVDGFGKYSFVNDWQITEKDTDPQVFNLESGGEVDCRQAKCLLVTSPGNVPSGWRKLDQVNFLDGVPAFELYEN